jgi:hypothetical protein
VIQIQALTTFTSDLLFQRVQGKQRPSLDDVIHVTIDGVALPPGSVQENDRSCNDHGSETPSDRQRGCKSAGAPVP